MIRRWKIDPRLAFAVAAVTLAALVAFARSRSAPGAAPAFTTGESVPAGRTAAPGGSGFALRAAASRPHDGALVYVTGAVAHAGVYRVPLDARILDALHRAGGADRGADLDAINLAQPLHDGDMVLVPRRGDEADLARVASLDEGPGDAAVAPHHRKRKHRARRRRASALANVGTAGDASSEPAAEITAPPHRRRRHRHGATQTIDAAAPAIDLNAASEDELETIPGIGPELASRIVAFRELNGPFASTDELLDVAGMTDARLSEIVPYLEISATAGASR